MQRNIAKKIQSLEGLSDKQRAQEKLKIWDKAQSGDTFSQCLLYVMLLDMPLKEAQAIVDNGAGAV